MGIIEKMRLDGKRGFVTGTAAGSSSILLPCRPISSMCRSPSAPTTPPRPGRSPVFKIFRKCF